MLFSFNRAALAATIAAFASSFVATANASPIKERGASMYLVSGDAAPMVHVAFSDHDEGARISISAGRFNAAVDEAAKRNGVPVALARAVMRVESGGNCRARSSAGAIGVMQVLPATARALGVYGPLTDCRNSAEAGNRYLARLIAEHGVSCASLSLYERGLFARPVCTSYGRKVLARI